MNQLETISKQQLSNYHKWSFVFFTLLTLVAILNGKTTPFYLIYFFWWNEFIHLLVDKLFYKKNPNSFVISEKSNDTFNSFSLMGIYWIFIVVFFGLLSNSENTKMVLVNLEVLFFKNWFFNVNLIGVAVGRTYMHLTKKFVEVDFGALSPNIIILHISIIVGSLLIFFLVRKYPGVFTPENLWGSVVIITPFLLLKILVLYLTASKSKQ